MLHTIKTGHSTTKPIHRPAPRAPDPPATRDRSFSPAWRIPTLALYRRARCPAPSTVTFKPLFKRKHRLQKVEAVCSPYTSPHCESHTRGLRGDGSYGVGDDPDQSFISLIDINVPPASIPPWADQHSVAVTGGEPTARQLGRSCRGGLRDPGVVRSLSSCPVSVVRNVQTFFASSPSRELKRRGGIREEKGSGWRGDE